MKLVLLLLGPLAAALLLTDTVDPVSLILIAAIVWGWYLTRHE